MKGKVFVAHAADVILSDFVIGHLIDVVIALFLGIAIFAQTTTAAENGKQTEAVFEKEIKINWLK